MSVDALTTVVSCVLKSSREDYRRVYSAEEDSTGKHQFLFFVKPELLDTGEEAPIRKRFELIFEAIERHELRIEGSMLLSGGFLARHSIVSEHYGVIDGVARNPDAYLAEAGVQRFFEIFDGRFKEARIVGAVEYLRAPNLNGVHLSAGPVEGLVELIRFTDDRSGDPPSYREFSYGKQLDREFSSKEIRAILSNPDVSVESRRTSIFDLTEESDADEAISKLREVMSQVRA